MADGSVSVSARTVGGEPWTTVGWLRAKAGNDLGLERSVRLALCHRGRLLSDDTASLAVTMADGFASVVVVPGYGVTLPPASIAPAPAATATGGPSSSSEEDDEVCCRICFDGETSRTNRMVSPCRCAGSMLYVHTRCLSEWRLRAVGTQSFHRCDQCRAPYALVATPLAPLLRSPSLLHGLTLLGTACAVASFALLPVAIEARFFRLVDWRPWGWLARRRYALRVVRGLLVLACAGLAEHLRQLLRRDQTTRDACLRVLLLSCAANGPRILRIFAVFGVVHSLAFAYAGARQRVKTLMLQYGEVLVDRLG